jgi:protein phosphatase
VAEPLDLAIPELSLVVLIGASGSGKSSFARKHFLPTEVLSSDECRALVSDDATALDATGDAFEVLQYIAAKRLQRGRLTVIDATSVKREDRRSLIELARKHYVLPVAIVLDVPERLCLDRNRERPDRNFGPHVVRNHVQQLKRSLPGLKREGFNHAHVLKGPDEIDAVRVVRQPLWNDRRDERGPFDIIGDVHGCTDELGELLIALGYDAVGITGEGTPWSAPLYRHPAGRKAIFLGDLGDRGPRILDAFRLVRAMVEDGGALCIPGNHDVKLERALQGRNVRITHGLATTLAEIDAVPEDARAAFRAELREFLDRLVSHYVLDGGDLVVAHAGMKAAMQGRAASAVRNFALYGDTTGETDEFGLPVRYDWASEYRGKAAVVYGHTPVREPQWLNNTVNIDTGCVFGGSLTALRYPEREFVSVPAHRVYYEPVRPFPVTTPETPERDAQQQHDDVLEIDDVLGKRVIATDLFHQITIREENANAALEIMSRFAIDPRWLIYLPPTMAPTDTSNDPQLLEHPREAFAYYRREGVTRVICEEKHMGSRAVVIVGREADALRRRFGLLDPGDGRCYTRTGRPFFTPELERALIAQIRDAVDRSGLWDELETDWLCLDAEIMPWSAKAQALLQMQYAPTGAAGRDMLAAARVVTERAAARGLEMDSLPARLGTRIEDVSRYIDAYRRYSWRVDSVADLKIAPFHLLAGEGHVYVDRDHLWHLEIARRLRDAGDGILCTTNHLVVDLDDPGSEAEAVAWWSALTESGGEGMVVKPLEFMVRSQRGLVQPAVKCRGREYLRIIYGPEYTEDENMQRLRTRSVGAKRALALREFALGIEALRRFVNREPLRRVHECVFGVLALESTPIDPRL